MKSNLLLTLPLIVMLAGCGKNKGGSGGGDSIQVQGYCSQSTIDLHAKLSRLSEKGITSKTNIRDAHQSCVTLESTLGSNSCQADQSERRQPKFLSYSQVSNFCAEVSTYVTENNNPRINPPQPVVVSPTPIRPRYDQVLIEKMGPQYALYFQKSYLNEEDFDVRSSEVRCQISMSDSSNVNLRRNYGKLAARTIHMNRKSTTTYDLSLELSGSGELLRLTCHSRSYQLTVKDVNEALRGVAEIRIRN